MSFTILTTSTTRPCADCGAEVPPRFSRVVQVGGGFRPWCPPCLAERDLTRWDAILQPVDDLVRLLGEEPYELAVVVRDLVHSNLSPLHVRAEAARLLKRHRGDERVAAALARLEAAVLARRRR
ncbi:MAG: hypothetical protein Q7T56_08765 [Nocardioidaceae bacterium]|nr:hypothetical protein [Nocardioidaceae bacterium]